MPQARRESARVCRGKFGEVRLGAGLRRHPSVELRLGGCPAYATACFWGGEAAWLATLFPRKLTSSAFTSSAWAQTAACDPRPEAPESVSPRTLRSAVSVDKNFRFAGRMRTQRIDRGNSNL